MASLTSPKNRRRTAALRGPASEVVAASAPLTFVSQGWRSGFGTFFIGMSAAALAFCVGFGFRMLFNPSAG
jgi:hypothetical protein